MSAWTTQRHFSETTGCGNTKLSMNEHVIGMCIIWRLMKHFVSSQSVGLAWYSDNRNKNNNKANCLTGNVSICDEVLYRQKHINLIPKREQNQRVDLNFRRIVN